MTSDGPKRVTGGYYRVPGGPVAVRRLTEDPNPFLIDYEARWRRARDLRPRAGPAARSPSVVTLGPTRTSMG
jgi:hypothetical protein